MTHHPPRRVWVAWCTGCGAAIGAGPTRTITENVGYDMAEPHCPDATFSVHPYVLALKKGKKR